MPAAAVTTLRPAAPLSNSAAESSSISLAVLLPRRHACCCRCCGSCCQPGGGPGPTGCSSTTRDPPPCCCWLLCSEAGSSWSGCSGALPRRWRGTSGDSAPLGVLLPDPGWLPCRPASRSDTVGYFCRHAEVGSSSPGRAGPSSSEAGVGVPGGSAAPAASAAAAARRRNRWTPSVNCHSVAAAAGQGSMRIVRLAVRGRLRPCACACIVAGAAASIPPAGAPTNVKRSVGHAQALAVVAQGAAKNGALFVAQRGYKHERQVAHIACGRVGASGVGKTARHRGAPALPAAVANAAKHARGPHRMQRPPGRGCGTRAACAARGRRPGPRPGPPQC